MNEMIELEKRVQRSTNEPINEEVNSNQTSLQDVYFIFDTFSKYQFGTFCREVLGILLYQAVTQGVELVQSSKKENVTGKTVDQIEETNTIWKSFQAFMKTQLFLIIFVP